MGQESGGLHFYGKTSSGKTTAALVIGQRVGRRNREGVPFSRRSEKNSFTGPARRYAVISEGISDRRMVDGSRDIRLRLLLQFSRVSLSVCFPH
jgi:hypothetical protein